MSDPRSAPSGAGHASSQAVDPNDLILLMLAAPGGPPDEPGRCRGITRLEKLAYLLQEETDFDEAARLPTDALHFRAYHYGPYSQALYDGVSLLASIGLIRDRRVDVSSRLEVGEEFEGLDWTDLGAGSPDVNKPYFERQIELTDKGELVAGLLAERIGDGAMSRITDIKRRYGSLPLRQLLRYVYDTYPEMAAESRIRDEL
jgi:hypothetical protein